MGDMRFGCYWRRGGLACAESAAGQRGGTSTSNPVTLCDDREVFFVAASGQIRMTANTLRTLKETDGIERLHVTHAALTGSVTGCALRRDHLASCLRGIRNDTLR